MADEEPSASPATVKVGDCRCAVCRCCKHDHGGWDHAWTRPMSDGSE